MKKDYTFYQIRCKDENIKQTYVACTTNLIDTVRKLKKRVENTQKYDDKIYQFIRDNDGIDNFEIKIIDTKNISKKDVLPILKHYIMEYNSTLNFIIEPGKMP